MLPKVKVGRAIYCHGERTRPTGRVDLNIVFNERISIKEIVMKKVSTLVMALFLVALCFCQAQAVEVLISPDTLVIDEEDTDFTLTVHAEIRYSLVLTSTVELDDDRGNVIGAVDTFPDSRGDLVAKFPVTKAIAEEWLKLGSVELTLTCDWEDENGDVQTFEGSSTISIVTQGDGPDGKTQNQEGNRVGAEEED